MCLVLGLAALGQNFIINGGFEDPQVTAGFIIQPGDNTLPSWTIGGGQVVELANGPLFGSSPIEGLQDIILNPGNTPPGVTLSQSFSTTVGVTYSVSFAVGLEGGGGGFAVEGQALSATQSVLGTQTTPAIGTGSWAIGSFNFTASTTTSTLVFTDVSAQTVNGDVLLDDVVVNAITPVPEPAEYAAVAGLALAAFGAWRRTRR